MGILSKYFKISKNLVVQDQAALRHKVRMKPEELKTHEIQLLSNEYYALLNKYHDVVNFLLDVLPEAQRLEVENEFMLKLINEHRIAE